MRVQRVDGIPCLRCDECGATTGDIDGGQDCRNCGTPMRRVLMKVTRRITAIEQDVVSQTRQKDGVIACRLECGHAAYIHDVAENETVVSTGCATCAREKHDASNDRDETAPQA